MMNVARGRNLVLGMAIVVGSLGLAGCSENVTSLGPETKGKRDEVQKAREGATGNPAPTGKAARNR